MTEWKNKPNDDGWWWVYNPDDEDVSPVYLYISIGEIIATGNYKWIRDLPEGTLWSRLYTPPKPTYDEIADCQYDRMREPLSVPYDPRWD
jgi:hypothetical protein